MKFISCGKLILRAVGFFLLLFGVCSLAFKAQANIFARQATFLPAEQAFVFLAEKQAENVLALHWDIADGYYLYQQEIQIVAENATIAVSQFPQGELHQDEFFGEVVIYRHNLELDVTLLKQQPQAKLLVTYQGCTTGFCYPPETQQLDLSVWFKASDNSLTAVKNTGFFAQQQQSTNQSQQQFASQLATSKYAIMGFFLLGLGLAFTPCVLPMLPLLSAIVIGQQRTSHLRALGLSIIYVQGMALTYSLLGLLVVAVGLPLQIALQSPYVLIGFSLLFVLLALSMFGLFELQLPQTWQNKLTQFSQRQKTGAFAGVFMMGMVAGLIASPCTTAPLSGVLLYVAQSGDWLIGGLTLYVLALGMGLPLILITLFGNKILPKSGQWLVSVKIAFGFVLLSLPIFLLSRILPEVWEIRLWALLISSFFLWLAMQFKAKGIPLLLRIICLISAFIAVKPLQDWLWQPTENLQQNIAVTTPFETVKTYQQLQQILASNTQPLVMLDLYADWCVACKEFEKYTFADPKVKQIFSNMRLLRVDMTNNSNENKQLIEKLKVMGLPTIIFFDAEGNERLDLRITGFMNADEFIAWLEKKSF